MDQGPHFRTEGERYHRLCGGKRLLQSRTGHLAVGLCAEKAISSDSDVPAVGSTARPARRHDGQMWAQTRIRTCMHPHTTRLRYPVTNLQRGGRTKGPAEVLAGKLHTVRTSNRMETRAVPSRRAYTQFKGVAAIYLSDVCTCSSSSLYYSNVKTARCAILVTGPSEQHLVTTRLLNTNLSNHSSGRTRLAPGGADRPTGPLLNLLHRRTGPKGHRHVAAST